MPAPATRCMPSSTRRRCWRLPCRALLVASQAADRRTYLMRPDLGRALHADGQAALPRPGRARTIWRSSSATGSPPQAVQRHAPPLLAALLPALAAWALAPLVWPATPAWRSAIGWRRRSAPARC